MVKEMHTESLLAELFAHASDMVAWLCPVTDEKGRVRDFVVDYCNNAVARFLGIDAQALQGSSLLTNAFLDRASTDLLFHQSLQVWQTGEPLSFTYYNPAFDRHFRVRRVKLGAGILTTSQDCTADVLLEHDRRRQDETYRQILDTAADGLLYFRALRNAAGDVIDFRIEQANKRALELGHLPADAVGRRLLEVLPHLAQSEQFTLHRHVVETGEPVRFETSFRNADSSEYGWFIVSLAKLADGVISNFVDVTDKKRHEEEIVSQKDLLSRIIDASLDAVFTGEAVYGANRSLADFRFVQVNTKFRQMLEPGRNVVGHGLLELFPAVKQTEIIRQFGHVLLTGEAARFESHYKNEGREGWYDVSVAKLDEKAIVVSFADITASKETRLQAMRSLYALKRSNESLEEFTRAASHDLQEPVRKVQFFAGRLKERLADRLDAEDRLLFSRTETAVTRMKLLVDDLRQYAHVNELPRVAEEVDLNVKVRLVLADLEQQIAEKEAMICLGELPVVRGSNRQLQDLFFNLLSNALTYTMQDQRPRIDVTAKQLNGIQSGFAVAAEDATRSFHLLEVADNGIGFASDDAERIFNVFTRLHGNHEYAGTGVGLAIVQKVVRNHNGYVRALSKPGGGASFQVLLPAW